MPHQEDKGVPGKNVMIVQDMYEGARTRVKQCRNNGHDPSGSRVTPRIFLEPLPFRHDYGCVGPRGIKDISPWCMLYADDIVLRGTISEVVEYKLE